MLAGRLVQDDTDAWRQRLADAGVPAAPVADVADVANAPQTEALGMLQPLPHPEIPDLRLTALPLSFDGERAKHHARRHGSVSTRRRFSVTAATTTTRSRRSPRRE